MKILGLVPPPGGSLKDLAAAGQLPRFVKFYLAHYRRRFAKVRYFSYDEADLQPSPDLEVLPGLPLPKKVLYSFLMPFHRWRQMKECSVLRITQAEGGLPAVVNKLCFGTPYVASYGFHYSRAALQDKGLLRAMLASFFVRLTLHFADGVIATTPILKRYLEHFVPPERLHLVPNGVDTSLFAAKPGYALADPPRLLFVGRLAPQKNLPLLLEACALLPRPVQVVLVGKGSLEAELRALASRLGVSVEFKGVVPHSELPGILASADVFVLPSLWEGHPKALLEAMACALPCVGTQVPGTRDVLENEHTGLLVPSGEADALAAALERLLDSESLRTRLGKAARAYIQADFELSKLLERELDLLEKVARDD